MLLLKLSAAWYAICISVEQGVKIIERQSSVPGILERNTSRCLEELGTWDQLLGIIDAELEDEDGGRNTRRDSLLLQSSASWHGPQYLRCVAGLCSRGCAMLMLRDCLI